MKTALFSPSQWMPFWLKIGMLCAVSTAYPNDASVAHRRPPTVHESAVLRPHGGAGDGGFGFAVTIGRDVAIVGDFGDSEQAVQSGAAYVFERNPSGVWIQVIKLFPQEAEPCQRFGTSVALDGDDDTLLIGQRGVECTEEGNGPPSSVYVFRRTDAGWVPSAQLQPPVRDRSNFAFFTALDSGKFAVASGETDAYVYRRQANQRWSSPVALPASASVGDEEYSGPRVAVSGKTVVLGSTSDFDAPGLVDIYEQTARNTWHRTTTIDIGRPGTDFWSRPHVAIKGDTLLADRFVYERNARGAWRRTAALLPADAPNPAEFPGESALSGGGIAVLAAFEFIGQDFPTIAYVYQHKSRGSWKLIATLTPSELGARFFGRLATDGRVVIAGGITADDERVAYIFEVPGERLVMKW